jgi:hypothetical protein
MNANELMKRINLIVAFTSKMNIEAVPLSTQKIFMKLYTTKLKFNLNDKMIENILHTVN